MIYEKVYKEKINNVNTFISPVANIPIISKCLFFFLFYSLFVFYYYSKQVDMQPEFQSPSENLKRASKTMRWC